MNYEIICNSCYIDRFENCYVKCKSGCCVAVYMTPPVVLHTQYLHLRPHEVRSKNTHVRSSINKLPK